MCFSENEQFLLNLPNVSRLFIAPIIARCSLPNVITLRCAAPSRHFLFNNTRYSFERNYDLRCNYKNSIQFERFTRCAFAGIQMCYTVETPILIVFLRSVTGNWYLLFSHCSFILPEDICDLPLR